MKLHPTLPTIIPCDSVPLGAIYGIPKVEIVNIVSPSGELLFERIEYRRRESFVITGLEIPGVAK